MSASSTKTADAGAADVQGPTSWARPLRPTSLQAPNPIWHVSPVVDVLAYHFSWAWVLLPMLAFGDDPIRDYLPLYALVLGLSFAHRHLGLPYAYLDGEVFRRHRRELTWFPLVCLTGFLAMPIVVSQASSVRDVLAMFQPLVFLALLWNFWHVYMQKYGILRLYVAKDPAPPERKTPGWVDRGFLFCWFPLYLGYVVPRNEEKILFYGGTAREPLVAVLSFAKSHQVWLVAPSVVIAVGALVAWLAYERRANGLRNPARLSAAAGMLLLSTALFWTDPVKAYVAFGFSHAVEYIVFVIAVQRRRYRHPRPVPSINERLVSLPWLWYGLVLGVPATIGAVDVLWGRAVFLGVRQPRVLDLPLTYWLFIYLIFESFVHFHLDGFLWKMRTASVRNELGLEAASDIPA